MPTIRKALVEFRAVHYPPRLERRHYHAVRRTNGGLRAA